MNSSTQAATVPQANSGLFSNRAWLAGLVLVVLALVIYLPAWNGKPVWDDNAHLANPELYSLDGLRRIWFQPGATQQYYPLVHTVFWIEQKLWGYQPLGYHLVNILLHAGSALLLVRILKSLEIPGAWLAAAIFVVHPVEVESVAWISELKNTLSGALYLCSALLFLKFDRQRRLAFYLPALALFLAGLMAKSVIATLPAALLVVLWWKRGALSWKRDVLPLLPFFGVGAAAGLVTVWMEKAFIGAQGTEFRFTALERLLIAGRAFWFYLEKLVWPVDLAFIYPRWHIDVAAWWQYLFPVAALCLVGLLWTLRKHSRGPLAAALFFAGTLFPALGFFNVYPFRYSFVADHFQYLASLGPIILAAVGMQKLSRFAGNVGPKSGPVLPGLIIAALAVLTWKECGIFADNETLWRATVARNPGSWMAHDNLGVALLNAGRVDEAIEEGRKGLELWPESAETLSNLGNALLQAGQIEEAITCYQKSLKLNPAKAATHYNLGNILLHQTHDLDGAISHLERCNEIARSQGKPENVYAHYDLGLAYCSKRDFAQAAEHYRKAVQMLPSLTPAVSGLAWILATCPESSLRNAPEALQMAQQAVQLTGERDAGSLETLGAAYAANGNFEKAMETAQKALAIAIYQSNTDLVERLQTEVENYQAAKPFINRETSD